MNLSFNEILAILIVALIFIGPKKLPELARSVGKGLRELRRASDDLKGVWDEEVDRPVRDVRDAARLPRILPPAVSQSMEKGAPVRPTEVEVQARPADPARETPETPSTPDDPAREASPSAPSAPEDDHGR